MKTHLALSVTAVALLAATELRAHHSFSAEFDANKRVTLKGIVTKVDWRNPHIYVYLNVKNESGKVTEWACEGGPPNVLLRQGWSRTTVKEGDEVTIEGAVAKDSSDRCNSRSVILSDGRKVFAGSSEDNPAGANGVAAQAAPGGGRGGRGPAAGQTVEKIRQLKPNLYMITGGGANTLIRVTGEGLIVVDTKNPGDENYNRVMEEIKSVSNLPVKYVINTHHHPDHVGNNQKFIDAGAQIIALDALKTRMASDPRTKDIPGLPTVTFAKDYDLKFGGAEVQAHSYGRGHTGDDTMVYFPDLKVVMVSDQITDNTPIVDFANGGSAVEWTQILDGVLKLDFDMAIPGRGEPKSKADVQAYRTKFATVVTRASDAIKAGATKDTLASQVKTDDLGWQFNPNFYGQLYDELTQK
jgi:glyoxylase-like metal-dependent hydrolase (beta-lactamase superfamily II)